MDDDLEVTACIPYPIYLDGFNPQATIPYGCTVEHIQLAMADFVHFLGFINQQLHSQGLERLETMLMPANFSSMVGEFMVSGIPKYCPGVARNKYHNGHPDLLPVGYSPKDAAQHATEGIEIKGSRYLRGWQGHNPEDTWLIVFVFDSNRPGDATKGI